MTTLTCVALERDMESGALDDLLSWLPERGYVLRVVSSSDALTRELRGGRLGLLRIPPAGWLRRAEHGSLSTRTGEWYLDVVQGCWFGCKYCFLKAPPFQRRPVRIYGDWHSLVSAVTQLDKQVGNGIVSTGELTDSLALAGKIPVARKLAELFSRQSHLTLELRTKSATVEELVDVEHHRRTIVTFSVMPQRFAATLEPGTSSVEARIAAASVLQRAGYLVGLNFEPLICRDGWQEAYHALIEDILRALDVSCLSRVMVGQLRWSQALGQDPEFQRTFPEELARAHGTEYRPGHWNFSAPDVQKTAQYEWLSHQLAAHGLTNIHVSMETREVIDAVGDLTGYNLRPATDSRGSVVSLLRSSG